MSGTKPPPELDPDFLVKAYSSGFFPMADPENGEIAWYSPDPRAIIPLMEFQPHRSLRRKVNAGVFTIRINTAFDRVIEACAERKECWISTDIIAAYTALHRLGIAHSVEAWRNDELAGGVYGVSIQGAFFGESMFTRVTDASKAAFVHLIGHLRQRGFLLLDSQMINRHMRSLGAVEIPRQEYLQLLEDALAINTSFLP